MEYQKIFSRIEKFVDHLIDDGKFLSVQEHLMNQNQQETHIEDSDTFGQQRYFAQAQYPNIYLIACQNRKMAPNQLLT